MSLKDRKKTIQVIIADRPYPIKVSDVEEDIVRKAARRINDKVHDFQLNYAGKDKQDYLAMCLLQYAIDMHTVNTPTAAAQEEQALLDSLEQLLHKALDPA